ncbi:sugar phosphate nucleotidyltransferase [Anaerobutyricum hallii]|uniref:sugar phosphate nucleotidyltransferase n=1 Tax=Anaerobutyricum hallii TaxID=39488 RepID=UPI003AB2CD6C
MAGGKGTRISSVASDIPKPMIKIEGKPVLEHEIECLSDRKVIMQIEDDKSVSKAMYALLDISKIKKIGWNPIYSVTLNTICSELEKENPQKNLLKTTITSFILFRRKS